MLLGLDAIKQFKLMQDEQLRIFQRVSKGRVEQVETNRVGQSDLVRYVNFNEHIKTSEFEVNLDHLKPDRKKKILELIEKHESVFAKNKYDIGQVRKHEAKIKLSELKYVAKKPYRASIPDQKEISNSLLINSVSYSNQHLAFLI